MADRKAVKWLLQAAGKYKGRMVFLILLQIAANGGAVCYALVMKQVVDAAAEQNPTYFWQGLCVFGFLMLVLLAVRVVLRQMEESIKSGMENTFKERLFANLLLKDYAQVNRVHSGEWMNRMTSDTLVCAGGMTDILPGFLGMLVRMAGALAMILWLEPQLAWILIPGGMVFVVITFLLRRVLKVYHKRVQEKDGAVRVFLQERISSMLILRTFGTEQEALQGAEKELKEYRHIRMQKALFSNMCNTAFSAAMNGMYLLGIGYCGFGIVNGAVSYGTLTAMMQLIGQLQVPLSGISGFVPRFYAMLASAERLMEIENWKQEDNGLEKPPEEVKALYEKAVEKIVFDRVIFGYEEAKEGLVLKEVGFTIQKGDFVAVTGDSGCGKSTLLKLLMGIYEPQAGKIGVVLQDGSNSLVKQWKRLFAYVPQGNFLMGGTIREVITFGREKSRQNNGMTVEKALVLACGEFVFALSDGLETVLGEKGAGLSEGQMQRLAVARALYADAPVLILDEATSALDAETEKRLLENLKQLTDKTVFLVTHRAQALHICNCHLHFTANGVHMQKNMLEEAGKADNGKFEL